MKEYNKPICLVMRINIEQTLLASSVEGGEVGGTTDHFDAKQSDAYWDNEE